MRHLSWDFSCQSFFLVRHLARYQSPETKISIYHDENGIEMDLVVKKPMSPPVFVEVKSTKKSHEAMTKHFKDSAKGFSKGCFSILGLKIQSKKCLGSIDALPWQVGLH